MEILTIIPKRKWTEDMHKLNEAIAGCASSDDAIVIALSPEYSTKIPNDVLFRPEFVGEFWGDGLYCANFYQIK